MITPFELTTGALTPENGSGTGSEDGSHRPVPSVIVPGADVSAPVIAISPPVPFGPAMEVLIVPAETAVLLPEFTELKHELIDQLERLVPVT